MHVAELSSNRLLSALTADDARQILPALEAAPVRLQQILQTPGEPVESIYFPTGGFCSVLIVLGDGRMIEVASVGAEGGVGTWAFPFDAPAASLLMVQSESAPWIRMGVDAYSAAMERLPVFRRVMSSYTQEFTAFVMQVATCNVAHRIEQRLARWLLVAHDRAGVDEFAMTQELMAMMVGATRPTVSVVAGTLRHEGLIQYERGRITIVDRPGLEQAACECYASMRSVRDLKSIGSAR